ncbi:MAG: methyltransferase [Pseudomonadota bacterium]
MTKLDFNATDLTLLFREIGLYNPKNKLYKTQVRKHQQILAYLPHIQSAINKLSRKRPIMLLDCGCGKSYLSFVLYAYCTKVLGRTIKLFGVDRNLELINACKHSAKKLGFSNMYFYCSDAVDFKPSGSVDIVYSLHACDTATDYTIATGANLGAKYIFSVSCCQHSHREKMSGHPLTAASRFKPYKERLVDMLGDTMRALLLEDIGYGVNIFEFVDAKRTPKNIMLRAIKDCVKKQDKNSALSNYQKMVDMFHFSPELEILLKKIDV